MESAAELVGIPPVLNPDPGRKLGAWLELDPDPWLMTGAVVFGTGNATLELTGLFDTWVLTILLFVLLKELAEPGNDDK